MRQTAAKGANTPYANFFIFLNLFVTFLNAQHIVRKTISRFRQAALSRAFEAWLLFEPSVIAYAPPAPTISDKYVAPESIDDDDDSFMSILQKKLSATIETTKEFASQGYEVASAAASASVDIVSSTVNLIVPQSLSPSAPLHPRAPPTPRSFASSPADPLASSPSPHAPISPSAHASTTAAVRPPTSADRLGERSSHLRVEVKSLRDIGCASLLWDCARC
jgi:hypothetical protein